MQAHCQRAGVEIEFERPVTDLGQFADCDLVVGADGFNSVVRRTYQKHFQPVIDVRPNKYVWYGTTQSFRALTLIFRANDDGIFIAHAYPYAESMSTIIVESETNAWESAGLANMSDAESRAYCEELFAPDLDDHRLLSNKSEWLNFNVLPNEHWHHHNVVLLGDALHTVHFRHENRVRRCHCLV